MRRKTLVILVIFGILVLGARDFLKRTPAHTDEADREIRFLQFSSLDPLLGSPLTELQNSIDSISEAALKGHWFTASRQQEELEQNWLGLKAHKTTEFDIEQEISRGIQDLGASVRQGNKTEVLIAAQKLTGLVRKISS